MNTATRPPNTIVCLHERCKCIVDCDVLYVVGGAIAAHDTTTRGPHKIEQPPHCAQHMYYRSMCAIRNWDDMDCHRQDERSSLVHQLCHDHGFHGLLDDVHMELVAANPQVGHTLARRSQCARALAFGRDVCHCSRRVCRGGATPMYGYVLTLTRTSRPLTNSFNNTHVGEPLDQETGRHHPNNTAPGVKSTMRTTKPPSFLRRAPNMLNNSR